MPIKRTSQHDRVDTANLERRTATVARRPGPVEVVLRGVSREPEGRTKELILYTCQATGKQSVRYRYQTGGQELSARNEGVTLFSHNPAEEQSGAGQSGEGRSGAGQSGAGRSGAGPETGPEKDGQPKRQDRTE